MKTPQIDIKFVSTGSHTVGNRPRLAIRLENLTKRYGSFLAANNINLEVFEGEFVTLLGPSGSGKTTTLMMVAGHQQPDSGRIFVDGQDITAQPPHLRRIGMVFQHYAIFPHMTVAENIGFPLRMQKVSKYEAGRAVGNALQMVRLSGLQDRYPNQLSGGQLQRVALARALVFGPSILLMDEPLSALDKQLRESMQLEIRRLQQELNIPTLYVTHDQHESLVLSDRVAVFRNGKIVQIGTPTDLYERPQSRFVAEFIGESNLFEGVVSDCGGGFCTVELGAGWIVRCLDDLQFQKGDGVIVGVRPEAIFIALEDTAGRENSAFGTIEQVLFAGSIRRVTIRTSNDLSIAVNQENNGAGQNIEPGQRVELSWKWSKTSIMPKQEEATNA